MNEEHEAHAVAQESEYECASEPWHGRPPRAEHESDDRIDTSRREALEHCDLHRIAGGHALSEVVVDRPAQRRGSHEQ